MANTFGNGSGGMRYTVGGDDTVAITGKYHRWMVAQADSAKELAEALERIEKWFGEFPETGKKWPDGTPMSYGAAYGSNGERDYMRSIARAVLAKYRAIK